MLNTRIVRSSLVLGAFLGLSLMTTQSQAQVIGFKLGPTLSTLQINDGASDENRLTSFGGGGFIRFGLGGLSLQPEILAVTKGSDIDGLGGDDVKLQLNYIEIPLLARFALGSSTSFTPYLMAGPSFGFEIGCDVKVAFGENESSSECSDDNIAARKSTDIGLTGVLGFEFRMGPGALLVEGRYAHGLTNLSGADSAFDVEARNRSFGIFAGYAIPLGATGIASSRRQAQGR